jgi:hypothetical protein
MRFSEQQLHRGKQTKQKTFQTDDRVQKPIGMKAGVEACTELGALR